MWRGVVPQLDQILVHSALSHLLHLCNNFDRVVGICIINSFENTEIPKGRILLQCTHMK